MCLKVVILSGLKPGNNGGSCYKENYKGPLWKGTKISVPRGGTDKLQVPLCMPTQKPDCFRLFVYANRRATLILRAGLWGGGEAADWLVFAPGLATKRTNPITFIVSPGNL